MSRLSSLERIELCTRLHNNKYDYSEADFSKAKEKTTVVCPIHGEFKIDFDHHYNQRIGCKYCSYPSRDTESFIKEATKKHNGFYDYSKTKYIDSHTPIIITCPIHGDFKKTPNAHLSGQGCPQCSKVDNLLESDVRKVLRGRKWPYIEQFKPSWLKRKAHGMSLDFFIPKFNVAIECQGKQHFNKGGWSANFDFGKQMERDEWKNKQCKANGVTLVYYARKADCTEEYLGKIFTGTNELMDYIQYL